MTKDMDMLDLAKHIVTQKSSTFEPEKFEDHHEEALAELINAKRNGKTVGPRPRGENVVDWMRLKRASLTKPQEGQEAPQGLCRSVGDASADRR
jgi:DNA end-binding protein Ku